MSDTQKYPFLTCDEMADLGMAVPEMLEALEDGIGPEAVWQLTRMFGGCVVYIPKKIGEAQSVLERKIGLQITKWLFDRYSFGAIQIPTGPQSASALKMAAFRNAFQSGKSHAQIAKEFGCHTRTVERAKRALTNAGFL